MDTMCNRGHVNHVSIVGLMDFIQGRKEVVDDLQTNKQI